MGQEQVRRMDTQVGTGKRKRIRDSTARKMPLWKVQGKPEKSPLGVLGYWNDTATAVVGSGLSVSPAGAGGCVGWLAVLPCPPSVPAGPQLFPLHSRKQIGCYLHSGDKENEKLCRSSCKESWGDQVREQAGWEEGWGVLWCVVCACVLKMNSSVLPAACWDLGAWCDGDPWAFWWTASL